LIFCNSESGLYRDKNLMLSKYIKYGKIDIKIFYKLQKEKKWKIHIDTLKTRPASIFPVTRRKVWKILIVYFAFVLFILLRIAGVIAIILMALGTALIA
jgi:hypothetical protein